MKQLSLFETPVSLTFDRLQETLRPILPDLWECVSDAFQSFVARLEAGDEDFLEMTVGERAQVLQPAIRRRLKARFAPGNRFGARVVRSDKVNVLIYDWVSVRIKKFRSDLSISNYCTPANDRYWLDNPTPNGILRAVFGYKPTAAFTRMQAFVTMPIPFGEPRWFAVEDQTEILLARKAVEILKASEEQPRSRKAKWNVKPKKDSSKKTGGKDATG